MIVGVGNDIIEVERVKRACQTPRFITRNFSEAERQLFDQKGGNIQTIALNFAFKEAVVKALGTGFSGLNLSDVEVLRNSAGKPYLTVNNKLKTLLKAQSIKCIHLSGSHCKDYVSAIAIAEGEEVK